MTFFTRISTRWLVAALVAGVLCCYGGMQLATWLSPQVGYFNLGTQAYQAGDMPKAVQFFDRSIAAYKAGDKATWLTRFINPKPSRELAAQANFHKAKALLQSRQTELAVEAFKESIRLNPGDQREGLSPEEALKLNLKGYEHLTPADVVRLHERAMIVKYDLEMLFKARPDLAQQQGKGKPGKGKPGDGPPQEAPGDRPGEPGKPGKGRPDDI